MRRVDRRRLRMTIVVDRSTASLARSIDIDVDHRRRCVRDRQYRSLDSIDIDRYVRIDARHRSMTVDQSVTIDRAVDADSHSIVSRVDRRHRDHLRT